MMLLGFDIGGTKCAVILGKADSHGNKENGLSVIDKQILLTDKPVYEMIELVFLLRKFYWLIIN